MEKRREGKKAGEKLMSDFPSSGKAGRGRIAWPERK